MNTNVWNPQSFEQLYDELKEAQPTKLVDHKPIILTPREMEFLERFPEVIKKEAVRKIK